MFARNCLSQAARLCSQQTRGLASSAACAATHAHPMPPRSLLPDPRAPGHPLFSNFSRQFFTANQFKPGREAQQNALSGARYQLRCFHADQKARSSTAIPSLFWRGSRAPGGDKASKAAASFTSTRGFCGSTGRSQYHTPPPPAMEHWEKWHKHHHRRWLHHYYRHHHHHHHRPRRPFRFLFKAIVYSTAIVAIPVVMVFGASTALPLLIVPLAVGGALFFAGSFVFFVLPVVLVGGAVALVTLTMPAALVYRDMGKILKRDEKGDTHYSALATLGKDWDIQPAGKDEYFHWTFPTTSTAGARRHHQLLDKAEIRVGVFDPEDQRSSKHKGLEWFDQLAEEAFDDDSDDKEGHARKKWHKNKTEYRSAKWDYDGPKDLSVKREGHHLLIQFEDDGEKMIKSKVGKKYVRLGQIVDRAASEMEASQGRQLGDQVVLVRRVGSDTCTWSPLGNLAIRLPFSRQWIRDVSEA